MRDKIGKEPFNLKQAFINYAIYLVMLILLLAIIIVDPSFLTFTNLGYILQQASPRLIVALGVGGVIILAGTDLSAGRQVGLSGVLAATLLQAVDYSRRIFATMPQLPVWVPMLGVMLLCMLVSLLHGFIVAKLRVAPFIASLGMQQMIYGGLSMYYEAINESSPIGGLDKAYSSFAQGGFYVFGFRIPYIIIYAVVMAAIMWVVWNKTRLGKNMYAIGDNREAAVLSGVNVVKSMIFVYMISGLLYGFAGFVEAARVGTATNSLGQGYELDAIAACVVGGISMRGGIGKISGVITGVLLFQIINFGLVFISVSTYFQYIIKGLIIIVAVAVDTQKYIQKK